jgi:hypothetical protein
MSNDNESIKIIILDHITITEPTGEKAEFVNELGKVNVEERYILCDDGTKVTDPNLLRMAQQEYIDLRPAKEGEETGAIYTIRIVEIPLKEQGFLPVPPTGTTIFEYQEVKKGVDVSPIETACRLNNNDDDKSPKR